MSELGAMRQRMISPLPTGMGLTMPTPKLMSPKSWKGTGSPMGFLETGWSFWR